MSSSVSVGNQETIFSYDALKLMREKRYPWFVFEILEFFLFFCLLSFVYSISEQVSVFLSSFGANFSFTFYV